MPQLSCCCSAQPIDLLQRLTVSDDLTCFRCPPKFGITAAETEMLPKVPRLLSAETETMPKVLKSTLLVPKPKRKPKFGRSLIIISAAESVDCLTVALNGTGIPKIKEKVKINSKIVTSLLNVLSCV